MIAPGPANDEFLNLLGGLAEEQLSPEQPDRLDELLAADPARCRQYAEFMLMVSGLRWAGSELDGSTLGIHQRSKHETSAAGPLPPHESTFIVCPSGYPASTSHARLFGLHCLVGATLFSYTIAAVILGLGTLAAWAWKTPTAAPQAAARANAPGGQTERGAEPPIAVTREAGQPDRLVRRTPKTPMADGTNVYVGTAVPLRYRFTDLGALPGSVSVEAFNINSRGQIVGRCNMAAGRQHAFLYSDGKMTDLEPLCGGGQSGAFAVNSAGQVVGYLQRRETQAFLYRDGKVTDLGTLGGQASIAYGINDAGKVVGAAANHDDNPLAFLFSEGKMIRLPGIGSDSYAHRINSAGLVAGKLTTADGDVRGFVYNITTGRREDVGTLGGRESCLHAINDAGQAAGYALTRDGFTHAILYSGGVVTDLHALGGGYTTFSCAYGINNAGSVVGQAQSADGAIHAFLWAKGKMIDLNSQIAPDPGWVLTHAVAINDRGQIVGRATAPDRMERAWLLTPSGGATERPDRTPALTDPATDGE
jgi:probable HAF family extracellular repeat protein